MSVTGDQAVERQPLGGYSFSQPKGNPYWGLQFVAEFLNAVTPTTMRTEWRAFLRRYIEALEAGGRTLAFGPLVDRPDDRVRRYKARITLREAKEVRQLIVPYLRYLYFDREHIPTTELPFTSLVVRLNTRFREGYWVLKRLGPDRPERGTAVLRIRKYDGSIERYAASFKPPLSEIQGFQESVDAIFGNALLSGELVRLKLCRQCSKHFVVVKDMKRDFCSDRCKKDHFPSNQRVQKSRKVKRSLMIDRAVAWSDQGKNYTEIKAKTNLPDQVLKKLRIVP
jgi:hypothetical protein